MTNYLERKEFNFLLPTTEKLVKIKTNHNMFSRGSSFHSNVEFLIEVLLEKICA